MDSILAYVKDKYNVLGFDDYIIAVYSKNLPNQHIKTKIKDCVYEKTFIYCAGNVHGKDVVFCVDVDGEVTDEKIILAICDKTNYTDCLIDIQVLDGLENTTVKNNNRQLNRHIKGATHGKRI